MYTAGVPLAWTLSPPNRRFTAREGPRAAVGACSLDLSGGFGHGIGRERLSRVLHREILRGKSVELSRRQIERLRTQSSEHRNVKKRVETAIRRVFDELRDGNEAAADHLVDFLWLHDEPVYRSNENIPRVHSPPLARGARGTPVGRGAGLTASGWGAWPRGWRWGPKEPVSCMGIRKSPKATIRV